jgi:hypothetical protein
MVGVARLRCRIALGVARRLDHKRFTTESAFEALKLVLAMQGIPQLGAIASQIRNEGGAAVVAERVRLMLLADREPQPQV